MRNTLRNFRAEDFEESVERSDEAARRKAKATKVAKARKRQTKPKPAPEPEVEETEPEAESNEVPEGTAKEILKWVGDDEVRAQQAIDVELEHSQPRSTLLADLEKIKADSEPKDSDNE